MSVALLSLALLLVATGCGKKDDGGEKASSTAARANLDEARSALSTMAPDAKLLLVQTVQSVSGTATPVWGYLFGSAKDDKTFLVYVQDGKAMGASEYGQAGLDKEEWAKVPGTEDWKVDSDEAIEKAKDAAKFEKPDAYDMGLVMYVPKSQATTSTTRALTWYVYMQSKDATAGVEVDAKTGEAELRKK